MNIVISGMKHCGKTTHGRTLAKHWNCPFIDTDDLIIELYEQKYGQRLSPRSIVLTHGEDFFRELEAEAVRTLIAGSDKSSRQIIALGGGVPANDKIGDDLKKLGFMVYLKVPPEIIFKRIVKRGLPPFLAGDNPYEKFIEIYKHREQYYNMYSGLTIEIAQNAPAEETGKIIIKKIEEKLNER